uniref:hypothetical protein n=1 Tax=Solobacterium moorei TaxID=102148 RepID=UPI0028D13D4D
SQYSKKLQVHGKLIKPRIYDVLQCIICVRSDYEDDGYAKIWQDYYWSRVIWFNQIIKKVSVRICHTYGDFLHACKLF